MTTATMPDAARVARGRELLQRVQQAVAAVLYGQDQLIETCLIALCARGHLLLEGLPGLGKTELVKGLARAVGLEFRRVQFTPDLLPSDITGAPMLEQRGERRELVFRPGPVFANFVLADEINRSSPKTQSALLEAMQERAVTVLGETHRLPAPFLVLATQNPIELEGTYPLPEAQLDRFLFKVEVAPPDADTVARILLTRRRGEPPSLGPVLQPGELDELFTIVDDVFLPPAVADYIARLVAATHASPAAPRAVREHVRFGASPRAAIGIAEAARAAALCGGRPNVDFKDAARVAPAALAHRLVMQHTAAIAGVDAAQLVQAVLNEVPTVAGPRPEAVR